MVNQKPKMIHNFIFGRSSVDKYFCTLRFALCLNNIIASVVIHHSSFYPMGCIQYRGSCILRVVWNAAYFACYCNDLCIRSESPCSRPHSSWRLICTFLYICPTKVSYSYGDCGHITNMLLIGCWFQVNISLTSRNLVMQMAANSNVDILSSRKIDKIDLTQLSQHVWVWLHYSVLV